LSKQKSKAVLHAGGLRKHRSFSPKGGRGDKKKIPAKGQRASKTGIITSNRVKKSAEWGNVGKGEHRKDYRQERYVAGRGKRGRTSEDEMTRRKKGARGDKVSNVGVEKNGCYTNQGCQRGGKKRGKVGERP